MGLDGCYVCVCKGLYRLCAVSSSTRHDYWLVAVAGTPARAVDAVVVRRSDVSASRRCEGSRGVAKPCQGAGTAVGQCTHSRPERWAVRRDCCASAGTAILVGWWCRPCRGQESQGDGRNAHGYTLHVPVVVMVVLTSVADCAWCGRLPSIARMRHWTLPKPRLRR